MANNRNFRARVIEPPIRDDKTGVGVEIELHENVAGLNGDTLIIHLGDETTFEEASSLASKLNGLGQKIGISNPR